MTDPLSRQLRDLSRTLSRTFADLEHQLRVARPLGEARLLLAIGDRGANANRVRAELGLGSSNFSGLIGSLERDGLVTRRPDPFDRRMRIAELTPTGRAELRKLESMSDEFARSILKPLSNEQRATLAAAMAQIVRLVSAARVTIEDELPTSKDAQHCLSQYYEELESRFESGFDPDYDDAPLLREFMSPDGAFLVVRLHGTPVGCGALKKLSADRAYLKRMWVSPQMRGLALGRRLLEALENKARELGYKMVCLETNKSLEEAQQLYRSAGYQKVEPFNDEPYAHHWFEKPLRSD